MKCKCGHKKTWHYGKEIGNKENDCRAIYQNQEGNIKSCDCEKFEE